MRPDNWLLTEDVGAFLVRAGDFLRSRPALHNTLLTVTERLRTLGTAKEGGEQAAIFGRLERGGKIHAIFYRLPSLRLSITPLSSDQADALAAHLAGLGLALSGVTAEHDTATAFAEAWQRHTNAAPVLRQRWHLYRLGTLTPPEPYPEGRGRVVGAQDREQLIRWCGEFAATVGEVPAVDASSWDGSRFADRHFTFWENPDGCRDHRSKQGRTGRRRDGRRPVYRPGQPHEQRPLPANRLRPGHRLRRVRLLCASAIHRAQCRFDQTESTVPIAHIHMSGHKIAPGNLY